MRTQGNLNLKIVSVSLNNVGRILQLQETTTRACADADKCLKLYTRFGSVIVLYSACIFALGLFTL